MATPRERTGRSSQFTDGVEIIFGFSGTISTDQNPNILSYWASRKTEIVRFIVNFKTPCIGGDVTVIFLKNGMQVASVTVTAGNSSGFDDQDVTLIQDDELSCEIASMTTTTPPTSMTAQAV